MLPDPLDARQQLLPKTQNKSPRLPWYFTVNLNLFQPTGMIFSANLEIGSRMGSGAAERRSRGDEKLWADTRNSVHMTTLPLDDLGVNGRQSLLVLLADIASERHGDIIVTIPLDCNQLRIYVKDYCWTRRRKPIRLIRPSRHVKVGYPLFSIIPGSWDSMTQVCLGHTLREMRM
jgi:hypothetical protein